MSSTRVKSAYTVEQDASIAKIDFKEPADYAMVDINPGSVFIHFRYDDKPFDETVTLKFDQEIDAKESSYEFKKDGDKLVHLKLVKKSEQLVVKSEHKFTEKRNHPKADPRGYSVKKPEKKNWDKIVAELDDSDEGELDANQALKKIYDGCDDDTRKAMEKSLYESNGTVLNMNWAEVGKGKVEPYKSLDEGGTFSGFKH